MDPVVTMIVDLLRRKQENEALNRGGPTAGAMQAPQAPARPAAPAPSGQGLLPRAMEPKHDGRSYEEIIAEMSR